jgi:hypothetical protein
MQQQFTGKVRVLSVKGDLVVYVLCFTVPYLYCVGYTSVVFGTCVVEAIC